MYGKRRNNQKCIRAFSHVVWSSISIQWLEISVNKTWKSIIWMFIYKLRLILIKIKFDSIIFSKNKKAGFAVS